MVDSGSRYAEQLNDGLLLLRGGDGLETLETLAALARSGVDVRTRLHRLLDEDPIALVCKLDPAATVATGYTVTTVEASEGLRRLLATFVAEQTDKKSPSGFSVRDGEREEGHGDRS